MSGVQSGIGPRQISNHAALAIFFVYPGVFLLILPLTYRQTPVFVIWLMLFLTVAVLVWSYWRSFAVVSVDGADLMIRLRGREAKVPLAAVQDLRVSDWQLSRGTTKIPILVLTIASSSAPWTSVKFMAAMGLPFWSRPVSEELRDLVTHAKRGREDGEAAGVTGG